MKNLKFKMDSYRALDPFWERLQKALENLPGNPKPDCKGFYFAWYCHKTNKMVCEKIGFIHPDKKFKYMHFSSKKVTQTLLFKKIRSKEFENNELEQYPGGIDILNGCAGTSGHDSMIDEAISVLFLIADSFVALYGYPFLNTEEFYEKLNKTAIKIEERYAPDNRWISFISTLMEEYS